MTNYNSNEEKEIFFMAFPTHIVAAAGYVFDNIGKTYPYSQ